MENPHSDANDLTRWEWLKKYQTKDMIIVTLITILATTVFIISAPDQWYMYGLLMPVWYAFHIFRWISLHKYNVQLYHNWEETYGGKMTVKKGEK